MAIHLRRVCAALAFCAIAPASIAQAATIQPGFDLFQTVPPTMLFEFTFTGVPLGTYDFGGSTGVQNVGNADTIIERTTSASVSSSLPQSTTIPITVDAFQLVTTAPNDEFGPNDYYYLTLASLRGGLPSTGTMDITFNTPTSGKFSYSITLYYDIREGSTTGNIVESSGLVLNASSIAWSTTPPLNATLIDGVNHDPDPSESPQDFWPAGTFGESDVASLAFLSNATPEPASLSLLLLSLPIFLRRRAF